MASRNKVRWLPDQLIVEGGRARAFTRRGYRYKSIVQAAANLPIKSAIIDGEAVVLGDTGLPDYQALERELGNPNSPRLIFYAFYLLHLNGRDLRQQPLIERKAALEKLLSDTAPRLTYAVHLKVSGSDMFAHACRMGLEGIVSKRADAPYGSGVQTSWVKVKCIKSDTFPIVAFVEKLGAGLRVSHRSTLAGDRTRLCPCCQDRSSPTAISPRPRVVAQSGSCCTTRD
ncbi:hypothetical protein NKH37_26105 [Mesorhizobium sp. M1217]|uniref:ATP-dependent DNA ligase n=1 Tax=Mesorhizobium sp. M1217 TaxID=2957070 RepID=UPI003339CD02